MLRPRFFGRLSLCVFVAGTAACYNESITGSAPQSKPTAAFAPITVYTEGFNGGSMSGGAGANATWSANAHTTQSPNGQDFLGELNNDSLSLTLVGLGTTHTNITVSFDLYLIRSWDGTDATWGPDSLELKAQGVRVACTTFSNNPGQQQNFDGVGAAAAQCGSGITQPAGTGASATNSLGYFWYAPFETDPLDATYHFGFQIPHTTDSITLDFLGKHLQSIIDESWGIDNLVIVIGP